MEEWAGALREAAAYRQGATRAELEERVTYAADAPFPCAHLSDADLANMVGILDAVDYLTITGSVQQQPH